MTARGLRLWGQAHRTIRPVRTATDVSGIRRRGVHATFTGGEASLLRPSPPSTGTGVRVSLQSSLRASMRSRLARVAAAAVVVAAIVGAPAASAAPSLAVNPPPGL